MTPNTNRCSGITIAAGWFICAISTSASTITAIGMSREATRRAGAAAGLNATTNVPR
jgi:hypothetical protein